MIRSITLKFPSKTSYHLIQYPAGEQQVRLHESVIQDVETAKTIFINARIHNHEELMTLLLLSSAIRECIKPNTRLILRLPYLPYARADRRFIHADCHGLEVFGAVLNTARFDEVQVLDVHNRDAAEAYVKNLCNVMPWHVIKKAIAHFKSKVSGDITVLFPDKGAGARYNFGLEYTQHIAYAEKKRDAASGAFIGFKVPSELELKNRNILIVDDICDGGGTFLGVAQAMEREDLPIDNLALYVTHGIFSKGFGDASGGLQRHFNFVYTTNSVREWPTIMTTQSSGALLVWDAFEVLARADRIQAKIDNRAV